MPDIALPTGLDPAALDAIAAGRHGDPFAMLGPHPTGDGTAVRACLPNADKVEAVARMDGRRLARLKLVHPAGVFAGVLDEDEPYLLRITWPGGAVQETEDPYGFGVLLDDPDLHALAAGDPEAVRRCLGARVVTIDGVEGTRFAVWAPNASRASVVGEFNSWDGRRHPMRLRHHGGIWEMFIPRVADGDLYKFELVDRHGHALPQRADPLARETEPPPRTASVVPLPLPFRWTDGDWMQGRAERQAASAPISIYELHAGSWLHGEDGKPFSWDGLAERLVPYVAGMGFTHLELMPIAEHPFTGSWGYQPLGLFAPTARFGPPEAFARFVDSCHRAGIGVLVDWVPAHFPGDAHGLHRFDGTALYEYDDPREGFHRDWNTWIYNLGRTEVAAFLLASALEWLDRYHVDGLRVDAVASMLYRDYSRNPGEWIPNVHGGRENLESIAFLRRLNALVAERHPDAVVIAEESTAWPGVTAPVSEGGLGFNYKWNMGWMHDTLGYIAQDPIHRKYHHNAMTFGLLYAFSERFMLPLSHDEVVYGKGSLLGRMPGDTWQRFANLRAYFGFMWSSPGKKLLFMGGEFGQEREWNHDAQLDWHLLDDPLHRGMQRLVRDLNRIYRAEPALHRRDAEPAGFAWTVAGDAEASVFAYLRLGAEGDPPILVVCNFTPVPRPDYGIRVPQGRQWREILNTDARVYGGGGIAAERPPVAIREADGHDRLVISLPPLSTTVLRGE
ncbi:1,4-alpha-glucan branching enzyme [Inquilinus ginsengisoli]|uniref:1,4-alpha-glucan branching protein GlgB n=1 Tax=Inquilinus ginsengisoli TaxID=363840 RepID=UPI003D1D08DA